MKIISAVVSLLFSSFGFASEEPVMLWNGFYTSMSAQDVLKKTQKMKETHLAGNKKVGLRIKYSNHSEN